MSKVREYYRHARSLGAFRALDCLNLARLAAKCDERAEADRYASPAPIVAREVMPDDSAPIHLSFGIKVY